MAVSSQRKKAARLQFNLIFSELRLDPRDEISNCSPLEAGGVNMTIICEFCLHYLSEGSCRLGLKIPKTMRCREFSPGMEKFCANPDDFVSPNQIVEMARFFGVDKTELKKVKTLAESRAVDGPC